MSLLNAGIIHHPTSRLCRLVFLFIIALIIQFEWHQEQSFFLHLSARSARGDSGFGAAPKSSKQMNERATRRVIN